jgi:hypothetical protein
MNNPLTKLRANEILPFSNRRQQQHGHNPLGICHLGLIHTYTHTYTLMEKTVKHSLKSVDNDATTKKILLANKIDEKN